VALYIIEAVPKSQGASELVWKKLQRIQHNGCLTTPTILARRIATYHSYKYKRRTRPRSLFDAAPFAIPGAAGSDYTQEYIGIDIGSVSDRVFITKERCYITSVRYRATLCLLRL